MIFSIQYVFKNDQYPKTLQEWVDVMRKVKFKAENIYDKRDIYKYNKNVGGERDK